MTECQFSGYQTSTTFTRKSYTSAATIVVCDATFFGFHASSNCGCFYINHNSIEIGMHDLEFVSCTCGTTDVIAHFANFKKITSMNRIQCTSCEAQASYHTLHISRGYNNEPYTPSLISTFHCCHNPSNTGGCTLSLLSQVILHITSINITSNVADANFMLIDTTSVGKKSTLTYCQFKDNSCQAGIYTEATIDFDCCNFVGNSLSVKFSWFQLPINCMTCRFVRNALNDGPLFIDEPNSYFFGCVFDASTDVLNRGTDNVFGAPFLQSLIPGNCSGPSVVFSTVVTRLARQINLVHLVLC